MKAENIIVKMKDEAYSILGSKNISVQFEHSSVNLDLKLSFEIRENLYFIFKELFNNKILIMISLIRWLLGELEDKSLILKANSMKDGLEEVKKFDPKRYLILMQPELNDLYY